MTGCCVMIWCDEVGSDGGRCEHPCDEFGTAHDRPLRGRKGCVRSVQEPSQTIATPIATPIATFRWIGQGRPRFSNQACECRSRRAFCQLPFMNRTLQKSAACLLVISYLVVGLCGDSLQEAVSAWQRLSLRGEESQSVYVAHAHAHGPDFHYHTHHYLVPRAEAPERRSAATSNQHPDGNPSVAGQFGVHLPHACPLLQLVATLKLSVGDMSVAFLPSDLLQEGLPESFRVLPAASPCGQLPRGPPAVATLAA